MSNAKRLGLTVETNAFVLQMGLLCLNRRFRAAGFLLSSLGSGFLLCQSLKSTQTLTFAVGHFPYDTLRV